jgi:hypothetical protein
VDEKPDSVTHSAGGESEHMTYEEKLAVCQGPHPRWEHEVRSPQGEVPPLPRSRPCRLANQPQATSRPAGSALFASARSFGTPLLAIGDPGDPGELEGGKRSRLGCYCSVIL